MSMYDDEPAGPSHYLIVAISMVFLIVYLAFSYYRVYVSREENSEPHSHSPPVSYESSSQPTDTQEDKQIDVYVHLDNGKPPAQNSAPRNPPAQNSVPRNPPVQQQNRNEPPPVCDSCE